MCKYFLPFWGQSFHFPDSILWCTDFYFFLHFFFKSEWERVCEWSGQREKERESSWCGLDLMTLRSWSELKPRVGRLTTCATLGPLCSISNHILAHMFWRVISGLAASGPPWNLSEMQILRLCSRPTKSDTLGVGPQICFSAPSRWVWCGLKLEKNCPSSWSGQIV